MPTFILMFTYNFLNKTSEWRKLLYVCLDNKNTPSKALHKSLFVIWKNECLKLCFHMPHVTIGFLVIWSVSKNKPVYNHKTILSKVVLALFQLLSLFQGQIVQREFYFDSALLSDKGMIVHFQLFFYLKSNIGATRSLVNCGWWRNLFLETSTKYDNIFLVRLRVVKHILNTKETKKFNGHMPKMLSVNPIKRAAGFWIDINIVLAHEGFIVGGRICVLCQVSFCLAI